MKQSDKWILAFALLALIAAVEMLLSQTNFWFRGGRRGPNISIPQIVIGVSILIGTLSCLKIGDLAKPLALIGFGSVCGMTLLSIYWNLGALRPINLSHAQLLCSIFCALALFVALFQDSD